MKKLAAGVDIGGTNTGFGLVDQQGRILGEASFPTPKEAGFDDYLMQLHAGIRALFEALGPGYQIAGVGIGAPNANYFEGTIDRAANLPWKGVLPVAEKVRALFPGIPVIVTNDAKTAAVGEMIYGAARGMSDFVVITLGTGLGSGFVSGGRIVYGYDSFAGELGHTIAERGGRQCGCGRRGCLETYSSASGIRRTVAALLAESTAASTLRAVDFDDLDGEMITRAARAGDPIAREAFQRAGEMLGQALATAVQITGPEAIFLTGGLAGAGDYIFGPAKKHMEESLLVNFRDKVKLLPSGIEGRNGAILGASALVWAEESGSF